LTSLSKKYEDWQVKQADDAIWLYNYYLTGNKKSPNETKLYQHQWEELFKKMINSLRLKHHSYSTEKSYLHWLRDFQRFMGDVFPYLLNATDKQDFLSHLAVERKFAAAKQRPALMPLSSFTEMYWKKTSIMKSTP